MDFKVSRKKLIILLLLGALGCILLGSSDWLMIYGSTAYEGELAWLTQGVAQIPSGRNAAALALSFPAVILYSFGLFALRYYIVQSKERKNYCFLTALGMTPWLALHLFYIMILYAFAHLMKSGHEETAYFICEAMFAHFSWVVILSEVLMLLPFLYLVILILRRKTVFGKAMALNNPLILYIVLKLITLLMPDLPFRLAFTNGLMSEAMLIWFIIFIFSTKSPEGGKKND